MSKRFQRRIEHFTCEQCGVEVQGNGYTNHCPHCFYSKHVDVFPGDRAESCGGLMEPIAVERVGGTYRILQRCQQCGFERRNRMQSEDDFDALCEIVARRR